MECSKSQNLKHNTEMFNPEINPLVLNRFRPSQTIFKMCICFSAVLAINPSRCIFKVSDKRDCRRLYGNSYLANFNGGQKMVKIMLKHVKTLQ